jgi:signal transduction histidine kinase
LTGVWLTGKALRPVAEIAAAAERIEATNLSGRLEVQGNDEFAVLASTFNSMLARLESSFDQLSTAYDAQKRFTGDASHELKTPLTTIKGRVGMALNSPLDPQRTREHLEAISRSADVMATMVQDLLLLARADEAKLEIVREEISLFELLEDAAFATPSYSSHPVVIDASKTQFLHVDRRLFTLCLKNLLDNAFRHSEVDSPVLVRGSKQSTSTIIEIIDSGEGIPAEHIGRVFERFHRVEFSRDRDRGGTGLGLSIVRSIVEAHNGTIEMESQVGLGTKVIIRLPERPSLA